MGVTLDTPFPGNPKLPEFVLWLSNDVRHHYPALITGRSSNRVNSEPIFFSHPVAIAGLLSFCAHDLGRRNAGEWGVLDFAGGIVVHAIAGFAALASVYWEKKKHGEQLQFPLIAYRNTLAWVVRI